MAIRLARSYTGRDKLLKFDDHFHGWHDHASFGVFSHLDGTATAGVLPEVAENILLAAPGNLEATRRMIESSDDIAAIILEPTGSTWGQVPVTPEFLGELRDIASKYLQPDRATVVWGMPKEQPAKRSSTPKKRKSKSC